MTTVVTTCVLVVISRFLAKQSHPDDAKAIDALIETYGPVAAVRLRPAALTRRPERSKHWSALRFGPRNDFITDGDEYLRLKWMAAVPTICPLHRVPMEDSCNFCSAWGLPISERTSRGFRFVCADCKRPFASPQIIGRTTLSAEIRIRLEFQPALRDALNERNLRFPGAWIGPKSFLQMVRRFVLVTHEKDGRKRPTTCSSP